ncbi:cation transporter [Metarhizobium album]|uniref:Cation transporter n=1 Tax=Metarhizobium album TaxID=2182425 RepID=A0A2U2DQ71_9HYPH|nr:FixH family protein [Rhizobium album]PWE55465.1 cation transporter [Rhizobium album]
MNAIPNNPAGKGFTGRHMLAIMLAFFGVVIGVNMLMAWYATTSWSGLIVENTYVASQQFNGRAAAMRAMAASGIAGKISVRGGVIEYDLRNRDGSPAAADSVTVHFKRPVGDHQDFATELAKAGEGRFEKAYDVPVGEWIAEIVSKRGEETIMHEAFRFYVGEGAL